MGGFADGGSERRPAQSLCRREPVRLPFWAPRQQDRDGCPEAALHVFRGAKPGSNPLA